MFDNDHDCCHDHGEAPEGLVKTSDPASQSLSDALRLSFRLLTIVMILVFVAFLATGFKSIEENERGIIKVFGQPRAEVAQPGLAYNWPFPIGEIEVVPFGREEILTVDDFWLNVPPGAEGRPYHEWPVPREGLDIRREGALLTGDRFLVHMRLEARYTITDPLALRRNAGDPTDLVRSAVAAAAIRAAGTKTAEGLYLGDQQAPFLADTLAYSNDQLEKLAVGVRVTSVQMPEKLVPLAAREQYDRANVIRSRMNDRIQQARGDAAKFLQEVAGANYRVLVGEPGELAATDEAKGDHNLVGQYHEAITAGRREDAAVLLAKIDSVLTDPRTAGDASRIIEEAYASRSRTIETVKGRVNEFSQLLGEFRRSPGTLMQRHWLAAREEILESPTVVKYYLLPSEQKTVVRISPDPEVIKQVRDELLRQAKENNNSGPGR
jgi:regulator of protease activity HflC (stomatin/prohibitin superfamily)